MHEKLNIQEQFVYGDHKVVLTRDMHIAIDGARISQQFDTIEEAKAFAKASINNSKLVQEVKNIPEQMVVNFIRKHHESVKITNQLIESYSSFAAQKIFTLDPVIVEMKKYDVNTFQNKLEFCLEDGSKIAIDESTHDKLCELFEDKYNIIEYMRESKENFMHIIKQLEEE